MPSFLRHFWLSTLLAPFCLPSHARDGSDERDTARAVQFSCTYVDDAGEETESATISNEVPAAGAPRGKPRQVAFAPARPGVERMAVHAGDAAECTFPSGNRIRVKVGEGTARPYGMCGGDPDVFLSVWVNGRKIESQRWVAGHCYRDDDRNPDLRLDYRRTASGTRLERCEAVGAHGTRRFACKAYPDLAQLAVDTVEYPPPGSARPKPGAIERLSGTDPVCDAAQAALADDAGVFLKDARPSRHLAYPAWKAASDPLPADVAGAEQSVFDLNNDGKPERVLRKTFENNYMDGNVLMARYGNTAAPLAWTPSARDDRLVYLPCQLADRPIAIASCPPFSQEGDEANLSLGAGPGKKPVEFRNRYVNVIPFFFRNRTYLGLAGAGQPGYAAVLEPLATGGYRPACLFRRVTVNF